MLVAGFRFMMARFDSVGCGVVCYSPRVMCGGAYGCAVRAESVWTALFLVTAFQPGSIVSELLRAKILLIPLLPIQEAVERVHRTGRALCLSFCDVRK